MKGKLISCHCLLFSLLLFSSASAANYVGIILEGFEQDCTVQNAKGSCDCGESRQLYAGDKVIKKPSVKHLKIKWAPYSRGIEQDETTLTVVFEPPKDRKTIVQDIEELLGLLRTGHSVSVGATRSLRRIEAQQPYDNATLISTQKSRFVWEGDTGEYIVFKDGIGVEVYRRKLQAGTSSVSISPEEIGMRPGVAYTWSIIGTRSNRPLSVRMLPSDIERQITADLRQIDIEPITATERALRKAAYLQFMSDAYPDDIDLYWLSHLILEEIGVEGIGEDDKTLIDELKTNYLRHVKQTM